MRDLSPQLARLYYILRYYRKRQLLRRGWNVLRRRMLLPGAPAAPARLTAAEPFAEFPKWPGTRRDEQIRPQDEADRLLQGRFCFLSETRQLGFPPDWHAPIEPPVSRLWRFQLHYHDYLGDLVEARRQSGTPDYVVAAWRLVAHWIEQHPPEDRSSLVDAWHPYCIARRIPNWARLWAEQPPEEPLGQQVLASLWRQAEFLARNLEWDLRGNHLLEDLRGLSWAVAFFGPAAAPRWKRALRRHVPAQLREQVLPYGEHVERSAMYHVAMLEAVVDMAELLRESIPGVAAHCRATGERMADFLEAILLPDGEIPLLGDSCFGETPPARNVLDRARSMTDRSEVGQGGDTGASRTSSPVRVVGPYWAFRHGGDMLLFDAGPAACDWLPAHGHADLLHAELALAGRRVLTDSGVHDYDDSPERAYCRSTAAHNTLEIDGRNQCDVWSRFRMGYRGWPEALRHGQQEGLFWAAAGHNAYRRLGVPRVERLVACRPGGPWILLDRAIGPGNGTHRLISRLHFAPEVAIEQINEASLEFAIAGCRYRLGILGDGGLRLSESGYFPRFGERQRRVLVSLVQDTRLPGTLGFYVEEAPRPSQVTIGPDGLSLRLSGNPPIDWPLPL